MAKALALHMGLNRIDPKHYGTEGLLAGCVNDARAMKDIAASRGFTSTLLVDREATSQRVVDWLEGAARTARADDTVIVTYAGHGSQVADTNNPSEPDGKDETWCLYDRMLVDDELARCWAIFPAGVRILLISDSCHSATIARRLELLSASEAAGTRSAFTGDLPLIGHAFGPGDQIQGYRVLPEPFPTTAERSYPDLYRAIQGGPGSEEISIAATVLSLSACQDDETAGDGSGHGVFTQALLDAWRDGAFRGDYRQFFAAIKQGIKVGRQNPEYRVSGRPNDAFEQEIPFSPSSTGRKSMEEVMNMMSDVAIEKRFDAIALRGNGSRQHTDIPDHDFCRMQLLVPRAAVIGRSDQEVANFLQEHGLPTLIKGFLAATSVTVNARPLDGSVSCSADTKGEAGCKAEVSIRF
jgi:metacaspase-1